MSPVTHQATIRTNADLLSIGTSVEFQSKFKHFHSMKYIWKCCLENGGHFVPASMCQTQRTGISSPEGYSNRITWFNEYYTTSRRPIHLVSLRTSTHQSHAGDNHSCGQLTGKQWVTIAFSVLQLLSGANILRSKQNGCLLQTTFSIALYWMETTVPHRNFKDV